MTGSPLGGRRGAGRPPGGEGDVRAALLRAAATRFSQDGYAATSTRAILLDAEVTAPALYHHFDNKAGLYIAVAEAAFAHVREVLEAALSSAEEPAQRMIALARSTVSLRREHPHVARFLAVIEEDRSRHRELAVLASQQRRMHRLWRRAAEGGPPGSALAIQAVVEGLLRVGGPGTSTRALRQAVDVIAGALR